MTLLRQIQEEAASTTRPLSDLLRKCKILAVRLRSSEFSAWVDRELNGYETAEALPDYRVLQNVESHGHFVGPGGSGLKNGHIPPSCLPAEYREFAEVEHFTDGVSVYEELLKEKKTGTYQTDWPADLVVVVGENIYEGMNCLAAWKVIPRGAVVRLVDNVRNKVLAFALEIEQNNPDAGEATAGETPVAPTVVSQVFHSNFYASVGNVATGGSAFTQASTVQIATGDFASLQQNLQQIGLEQSDIDGLQTALAGDRSEKATGIGKRVTAWMAEMLSKAASGAWGVSLQTAAAVLPKVIGQYLGLPGS